MTESETVARVVVPNGTVACPACNATRFRRPPNPEVPRAVFAVIGAILAALFALTLVAIVQSNKVDDRISDAAALTVLTVLSCFNWCGFRGLFDFFCE